MPSARSTFVALLASPNPVPLAGSCGAASQTSTAIPLARRAMAAAQTTDARTCDQNLRRAHCSAAASFAPTSAMLGSDIIDKWSPANVNHGQAAGSHTAPSRWSGS